MSSGILYLFIWLRPTSPGSKVEIYAVWLFWRFCGLKGAFVIFLSRATSCGKIKVFWPWNSVSLNLAALLAITLVLLMLLLTARLVYRLCSIVTCWFRFMACIPSILISRKSSSQSIWLSSSVTEVLFWRLRPDGVTIFVIICTYPLLILLSIGSLFGVNWCSSAPVSYI